MFTISGSYIAIRRCVQIAGFGSLDDESDKRSASRRDHRRDLIPNETVAVVVVVVNRPRCQKFVVTAECSRTRYCAMSSIPRR